MGPLYRTPPRVARPVQNRELSCCHWRSSRGKVAPLYTFATFEAFHHCGRHMIHDFLPGSPLAVCSLHHHRNTKFDFRRQPSTPSGIQDLQRKPHRFDPAPRGFLPWRFSDAGPGAPRNAQSRPASENVHNKSQRRCSKGPALFDHLIGEELQRSWHRNSKRLCDFHVDDQFKLTVLVDRQFCRLGPS